MNLVSNIIKLYKYWMNPKYRIMKGVCIYYRCILFIGVTPIVPKDIKREYKIHGYCDEDFYKRHYISFKNQDYTYSKSNKLCTIWTFKQLIKWRRLLPKNGYKCLEKKLSEWIEIKD